MSDRTFRWQGVERTVSKRDFGLWRLVMAGDIEESDIPRFQELIPGDDTPVYATIREARGILEEETTLTGVEQAVADSDPDGENAEVAAEEAVDEFGDLTPNQRLQLYTGIALWMYEDLSSVPIAYIDLYAYGAQVDTDATNLIDDIDDVNVKELYTNLMSQNLLQDEIMELQYGIEDQYSWDLNEEGRPVLRDGAVSSETQMKLARILEDPGGARNERLFDIGLITATTIATGGIGAALGAPALIQTAAAVPRGITGSLAIAGSLSGKVWGSTVGRVAVGGSGIVLGTGTAGLISRSLSLVQSDIELEEKLVEQAKGLVPSVSPRGEYGFPFNPDDPTGRFGQFGPGEDPLTIQRREDPSLATPQAMAGAAVPGYGDRAAPSGEAWTQTGPEPPATSDKVKATARAERQAEVDERLQKEYEQDPFIGVPRDYSIESRSAEVVKRWEDRGFTRRQMEQAGMNLFSTAYPEYRESDVMDIIGNSTPQQLENMQQWMVDARLISPDSAPGRQPYYPGVAGYQTVEALEYVLSLANRGGGHYLSTLEDMAVAGRERTAQEEAEAAALEAEQDRVRIAPYVPETYLEPDMASLRVMATDAVEQGLGRQINQWELELLADQMKADHRQNYDQQEAGRRAAYTAEADMYSGGALYEPTYAEAGEPVEAIDYEAQMAEQFNTMFAKEKQQGEQKDYVADRSQQMFAGMDNAISIFQR